MARFLKTTALVILVLATLTAIYGAKGYRDALTDAAALASRADDLIARNRGGAALGPGRMEMVIRVQDPGFADHRGIDLVTPGAGITTITQSLSKRLAFDAFKPGLRKIRQTGYALGLERRLTKAQIVALWLRTLEMGPGPDGWMTGLFHASNEVFGRDPADLTEAEFLRLLAVLIAPAKYDLQRPDATLDTRVTRIRRLLSGECEPEGQGDVWLDGCG